MKKHKKKNKRESAYEKVLAPGEIIPLWRDMMFCQIFGDKNYEFALNYMLATIFDVDVNDIKGHLTYLVKDLKNYNKIEYLLFLFLKILFLHKDHIYLQIMFLKKFLRLNG